MAEEFMVEKSRVENSPVEKSRVEVWSWIVRVWNVLQPFNVSFSIACCVAMRHYPGNLSFFHSRLEFVTKLVHIDQISIIVVIFVWKIFQKWNVISFNFILILDLEFIFVNSKFVNTKLLDFNKLYNVTIQYIDFI